MCLISAAEVFQACVAGRLDQLKSWKADGRLPNLMTPFDLWCPHECAAANGHLELLQWLVSSSGQHIDLSTDIYCFLRKAAANGHLEVVKWGAAELRSRSPLHQKPQLLFAAEQAFYEAAKNGQLDVLKWFLTDSGFGITCSAKDNYALRMAAQRGHLAVVKWLVAENGLNVAVHKNDTVLRAAEADQFEIVSWLTEESGQLAEILEQPLQWIRLLPEAMQHRLRRLQTTNQQLAQLGVAVSKRNRYLLSAECQHALALNFVTTHADLDKLVRRESESQAARRL